jgi:hypothetical protein
MQGPFQPEGEAETHKLGDQHTDRVPRFRTRMRCMQDEHGDLGSDHLQEWAGMTTWSQGMEAFKLRVGTAGKFEGSNCQCIISKDGGRDLSSVNESNSS